MGAAGWWGGLPRHIDPSIFRWNRGAGWGSTSRNCVAEFLREGFGVYLVSIFKKQLVEGGPDFRPDRFRAFGALRVGRRLVFVENELKSLLNSFELKGGNGHILGGELN